jgi:outer membrane protein assembly factor BamB
MDSHRKFFTAIAFVILAFIATSPTFAETASLILDNADMQGGLIVHLGCGDGRLTATLRANDACVVQGLAADPAAVEQARTYLQSQGLGGVVTVDLLEGTQLPYVDNLINLIVAENLDAYDMDEVMRVLCPGGTLCVIDGDSLTKTVKPWPEEIDEWTHYLHDAKGTSVSDDLEAGHPRGLQWAGGPFWARSHEHTASMTALVSTAGRIFYVMDEGPTASIQLPGETFLTARDAFNGVVLWKRPLTDWWNPLYPLKSGPGWLPRRLVAIDDRVYIAPGVGQNVICLDAATGDLLQEYPNTASAFELVVSDGILYAAVDPDMELCDYNQQNANCWKERDRASGLFGWLQEEGGRIITALRTDDAETLWQHESPVAPMSLAADAQKVCFYDGDTVVALNRLSGEELWKTDVLNIQRIPTGSTGPRLILEKDSVILSPSGNIVALANDTGEVVWTVQGKPRSGHFSLEDFYVIGEEIWALGKGNAGAYVTYDLETGETLDEYRNPISSFYIHQRCHPGRATVRYQLPPMMGVAVYDMEEDEWFNNHWVRGGCVYGVMPANGMVYATPHACACYYQSKLNGFNALTPVAQSAEALPPEERLMKGPAYGEIRTVASQATSDWPAFRHDSERSGYARTDVPAKIAQAWRIDCGTKLTQPVAVAGKVFLSEIETHKVFALDAESGEEAWCFISSGRVNSPPTIHEDLALFGCADGYVYALRASDGALVWKFLAAPNTRKLISYGQLESVWPLDGSVLIQDDKLYCVAGRSMFLDGGLRLLILNPMTGELISENVMDRDLPNGEGQLDDLVQGKHLPVAMPDILSSDGDYVYMKSQTFTPDGVRVRVEPQRPDTQYGDEVHLFSPVSFLDDSWHQRIYWLYGRAAGEGWAEFQLPPKRVPYGRIICLDETNAYSYGRDPELLCNTSVSEYRLFSADKFPTRRVGAGRLEGTWAPGEANETGTLAGATVDWHQLRTNPIEKLTALDYAWVDDEPEVMARAMVLANDRLFVAGPRDVVDEKQMWGLSNEEAFAEMMTEQAAWFDGAYGGVMQVFSKETGEQLAEYELPSLPAFDGMIAADGALFVITEDGAICCYRGE